MSAHQINNRGEVIGYSFAQGEPSEAILWRADRTIEPIGNLPGQYQIELEDLNDVGAICGTTFGQVGTIAYLRSPNGTFTQLRNPVNQNWAIYAFGVNNDNVVVGDFYVGQNQPKAYLWTSAGGFHVLNDLLEPQIPGWEIRTALGINDSGQIVAGAWRNGAGRVVLLNPVPEPSTAFGIAVGLGFLLPWIRRKTRES